MTEPQLPGDTEAATPAARSRPGSPGARPPAPHITVPDQLLVDEPGGIVISGCQPGQAVTVTASSRIDGFVHQATATFTCGTSQIRL
jgi:hypothetical protein